MQQSAKIVIKMRSSLKTFLKRILKIMYDEIC